MIVIANRLRLSIIVKNYNVTQKEALRSSTAKVIFWWIARLEELLPLAMQLALGLG